MPNELKPCPFCGGEAKVNEFNDVFFVACVVCQSETIWFETPEEAIEAWNRRVDNG